MLKKSRKLRTQTMYKKFHGELKPTSVVGSLSYKVNSLYDSEVAYSVARSACKLLSHCTLCEGFT